MGTIQVEDWIIDVNEARTTQFYAERPFDQELAVLNYVQVSSFTDFEVMQFLEQLGVDILKPCELNSLPIEGDMVMYSGCYYVYGEIVQGELDNWDVVIGQHCFSLTEGNSDMPEELVGQVVEISFEVVYPWMLEEPLETP